MMVRFGARGPWMFGTSHRLDRAERTIRAEYAVAGPLPGVGITKSLVEHHVSPRVFVRGPSAEGCEVARYPGRFGVVMRLVFPRVAYRPVRQCWRSTG